MNRMKKMTAVVASAMFAITVLPVSLLATANTAPAAEQVPVGTILGTTSTGTVTPLGTATVQLLGQNATVIGTTSTNALGGFTFAGVPAGSYTVAIVQTVSITAADGTISVGSIIVGAQTVTVVGGGVASITITATAQALEAFTTAFSTALGGAGGTAAAAAAAASGAAAAAGSAGAAIILSSGSATAGIIAGAAASAVIEVQANSSPSR